MTDNVVNVTCLFCHCCDENPSFVLGRAGLSSAAVVMVLVFGYTTRPTSFITVSGTVKYALSTVCVKASNFREASANSSCSDWILH